MTDFAYVGRHPICRHMRAVVVDDPAYAKDTANDVAEFIRHGLIVERVTAEEVRQHFAADGCEICDKRLAAKGGK